MKGTKIGVKKKVTVSDVVFFVVVYTGIGMGLKLLPLCVFHGQPLDSHAIAEALGAGISLMIARQVVWAIEYFVLGHII